MAKMKNLQFEFEKLVQNPEHPEASAWLKSVALAFWYESFVPSTVDFSGYEVAKAGFVLDKLSRYSCTPEPSKQQVRQNVLPVLKQRSVPMNAATKDALAQYLGVDCDLKNSFKSLLPYQKRHYRHAA